MSNNTIHILNGDSLKGQLLNIIDDPLIVTRECLIDGDVSGDIHERGLAYFYAKRAKFIAQYPQCSEAGYHLESVPEINKITTISSNSIVYCWFEEDLFCQVNFWFVIALLNIYVQGATIYLVKPNTGNEYNFAGMNSTDLMLALTNAYQLKEPQLSVFSQLWYLYQQKKPNEMLDVAASLEPPFAFVKKAVKAEQGRMPDSSGYGYPERQLLSIINELNTTDFSPVFQLFYQRMAVYSFGDLQVKRMFDQLIREHKR